MGIKLNGEYLNNLQFVDNVLIASSAEEIERMRNELTVKSKKARLTLDGQKTVMVSKGSKKLIKIQGEEINKYTG